MRAPGIRFKLSFTLILTAAIPLFAGIISVRMLAHKFYQQDKGELYQSIAENLSDNFSNYIDLTVGEVRNWSEYSELAHRLDVAQPIEASAEEAMARMELLDKRWATLNDSAPALHALLQGEVSSLLKSFQEQHAYFAEIMVTDRFGGLAGASNKTSDYYQADENWWQKAAALAPGGVWMEGIHMDESAGVYSLAICLPIYSGDPRQNFVGVLKVVQDVSPLFQSVSSVDRAGAPVREIVSENGKVLSRLSSPALTPMSESVSMDCLALLKERQWGWAISPVMGGEESLLGFSRLQLEGPSNSSVEGLISMYVVVRRPLHAVLAPILYHFLWFSLGGVLLLSVVIFAAVFIAEKKILQPIRVLRAASQKIASQAVTSYSSDTEALCTVRDAKEMLRKVEGIQTHDEIEDLAGDFKIMAQRVLQYHEQMERELTLKSEEVEHDLVLAREFQEGLIPIQFPPFVFGEGPQLRHLAFSHLYKPATSVGGDFFNVLPIDDHRIGVFMADVMGHGTRSALITSILRTLLDSVFQQNHAPDKLMEALGNRFYCMLPDQEEVIFATACYVVLDLQHGLLSMACAGHPHPFLIDSAIGVATEVDATTIMGPALGLVENPQYKRLEIKLQCGQSLFLYTDGVVEAENLAKEEFGRARLEQALSRLAGSSVHGMTAGVMDELRSHMGTVIAADDLCMVAVGMHAGAPPDDVI